MRRDGETIALISEKRKMYNSDFRLGPADRAGPAGGPCRGRAIAYGDSWFALVCFPAVMAGLVPAIHVGLAWKESVDALVKPGHDAVTHCRAPSERADVCSYPTALLEGVGGSRGEVVRGPSLR